MMAKRSDTRPPSATRGCPQNGFASEGAPVPVFNEQNVSMGLLAEFRDNEPFQIVLRIRTYGKKPKGLPQEHWFCTDRAWARRSALELQDVVMKGLRWRSERRRKARAVLEANLKKCLNNYPLDAFPDTEKGW